MSQLSWNLPACNPIVATDKVDYHQGELAMADQIEIPLSPVLSNAYPILRSCPSYFLSNHGGFSGARLWRVACGGKDFCLRAWPTDRMDQIRLQTIHALMRRARQSGLDVVPEIYPCSDGASFIVHADRYWDLTTWMPGRACFNESPTTGRLREASKTLAKLHRCWHDKPLHRCPIPAVTRRQACLEGWQKQIHSGWRPDFTCKGQEIGQIAKKSWQMLSLWTPKLPLAFAPWINQEPPLQMCLCDIWHDHLLFEGDRLTGLIDFGSVKLDHVAVDLARMLGSLVEDKKDLRSIALDAYASIRPLTNQDMSLVDMLDRTGCVLALVNWLTWLYWDDRAFDDYAAVAARMSKLVNRIEKWDLGNRYSACW